MMVCSLVRTTPCLAQERGVKECVVLGAETDFCLPWVPLPVLGLILSGPDLALITVVLFQDSEGVLAGGEECLEVET